MNIRKCFDADITRTAQFYDRIVLNLDEHVNYPRWVYGVYPGEHSVRTMVQEGAQYICEDEESIIAAFGLNTSPQGSYQRGHWKQALSEGSYMVIHTLAIAPEKRGQGIGSEIIRFCVKKAKEEGYRAIRVDIVPTNVPSKKLFEKNGFTYAGDVDLGLNIEDIPFFSLYELNW